MSLKIPKKFASHLSAARRRAPRQEAELARRLGGRTTRGSGNGVDKGDVRTSFFRVECKATEKKSFSVTLDMVDKIERAAAENGREPVIHIEFVDRESGKVLKQVAVVPAYVLDSIMEKLNK